MQTDAEWISTHALSLWALLLAIALLGADLLWRRAVKRREGIDPSARAILRPVTAIAVVMAAVLVSTAIALAVRREAGLTVFDAFLAGDLRDNMPPGVLRIVAMLTHVGDPIVVAVESALVFVFLLIRRYWYLATAWIVALVGTGLINQLLKNIFQRERPLHDHGFVVEHSFSFPSGHASGSMVFFGMLAYVLLVLTPPRLHRVVVVIATAFITVIGISRILLQVHYFSDVLAGYATGLAWLTLCVGSAEYLRIRRMTPHPVR
ncbi:undecaprenyl-diphosphatase [Luteibacter rhizovicinus]|uniref:undecaprenyl-diphosphate phosphatase n=1 Tax=Luteibacter rhizovicinus TaxID=242606 RepID=A0A4R3YGY0_9GAMM|nr:phosphatase PAP2 family protein [Luteibacter rhizovicinus]TCV91420.1 undecaprenyl-diphosphatase [Luteibacter rhizovicinus]